MQWFARHAVEVDFVSKDDTTSMLPGYSADIEVILSEHKDVLRIPTEAILEGNKVLVFGADGILQERTIRAGLSNWKFTEVLEGLTSGERIVLSVDRDGVENGALAESEDSAQGDD